MSTKRQSSTRKLRAPNIPLKQTFFDVEIVRACSRAPDGLALELLGERGNGERWKARGFVGVDLPLRDAHIVSGKVKGAIRAAMPTVDAVLVHMEPYELH